MAEIKHFKVVASLPSPLEPDSVYYVRVGQGYDQYVTNGVGVVVAYEANSKLGLENKVDKVSGKQLSDENYTLDEKNKLASLENFDDSAIQAELDTKVDKIAGKGLSTNDLTDLLYNKLVGLEGTHWRGTFVSLAALEAGVTDPQAGDYADVDVVGEDVQRYIWDATDNEWVVQSGAVATITAAQVKQLYESNPDTNVFTDAEKSKLERVSVEYYTPEGLVSSPKEFNAVVVANDGAWTCNYAIANFTKIHCIQVTAIASGTAAGDRRIACIGPTPPSLTQCSGALMSATSAGLLAAMTLISASGQVYVTVKGE